MPLSTDERRHTPNRGDIDDLHLDSFTAMEHLVDQAGAGAVLTFAFSAAVHQVWIYSLGAVSRAGVGATDPSSTRGAFCDNGVPCPLPVTASVVKVWAPVGATVSVWGFRYG